MKSFVVHVSESVCAKNNRDPSAASLIEAARSFGTVETLDQALASERAKYQAEINNLTQQHNAMLGEYERKLTSISEQGVTADELEILRVLRKKSANEAAEFEKTLAERDAQLNAIKVESENRVAQIRAIFGV